MKSKIPIILLLVLITMCGYAQEPTYIHYTTEDGLPSSEVHEVMQDSKGYMWFGTDNGVCRFNGYTFENFSSEQGLLDKVVFAIYEDSLGRIWVSQSNNKLCYFENNHFVPYKHNEKIPSTPLSFTTDFIEKILVDCKKNEVILKWNKHGISLINSEGEYACQKPDTISHLIPVEINSQKQLASFAINNGRQFFTDTFYVQHKKNAFLAPNYAIAFYRSKYLARDSVFFSIGKTAFISNSTHFKKFVFKSNVLAFNTDKNGFWFGLSNGKGVKYSRKTEKKMESFLDGFSVTKILIDKENNYWFTTLEDGIFCIPNMAIKAYTNSSTGLSDYCRFIKNDDKGNLYITRERDLYQLLPNMEIKKLNEKEYAHVLNMEIKDDNLWLYTNLSQEIYSLDEKTKLINHFENPFSLKVISKIKDSLYLTGSSHGVRLFNTLKYNKNSEHFPKHFSKYLLHFRTTNFLKISHWKYLVTTYNGLYSIAFDSADLRNFTVDHLGAKNPLLGVRIDHITYNPQDQCYWLASKEKGIVIWNPCTNKVKNITTAEGLADNLVTCIYTDSSIIYAGTKKGLNEIEIINDSIYNIRQITIKNGLPSNEINGIAVLGKVVYITTLRGLCYFNYKENIRNIVPPPIYISNLKINERDTSITDYYTLNYTQNNINIHYVGLAYKARKDIVYKFRLLGSDTTWKYTLNREVRFPDLSPEEYTFEVMAQNEDGYWSKEPARVSFTIKPPYWETWWFKSLIGIVAILFIGLIFQYRIRELKKRNLIRMEEERKRHKIKQEAEKAKIIEKIKIDNLEKQRKELELNLSKTKQKLVTQQLNPHFLFNTMSSIQYMIVNNQKMEAVGLLSKFARLMRQGLEYSRVGYAPLEQSIEFFKNYIDLKSINLEEKIKVTIDTSNISSPKDCSIPPMLIQPFIENAIIHGLTLKGKDMKLSLVFMEEGKNIKCFIEDNGIGRKESARLKKKQAESHKSFGVKIINETLEMMNTLHGENYQVIYTDLTNCQDNPSGTKVKINFPRFENGVVVTKRIK